MSQPPPPLRSTFEYLSRVLPKEKLIEWVCCECGSIGLVKKCNCNPHNSMPLGTLHEIAHSAIVWGGKRANRNNYTRKDKEYATASEGRETD